MSKHRILVLSCRNFGDAIVTSGLVESLGRSFKDCQIELLIREKCRDIFENNPYVHKVHFASFPLGNPKNFGLKEAVHLCRTIAGMRRYDLCINNIGHFGENFIGRCIPARESVSISWEDGHPFNNMIGIKGDIIADRVIRVPKTMVNLYDAYAYFASALGCSNIGEPTIYPERALAAELDSDKERIIGVHPIASNISRMWPFEKWRKLIRHLSESDIKVRIYAATADREIIYDHFRDLIDGIKVTVNVGNLKAFFASLTSLRLLIGLDSFAVHAANALRVPSIMLNGSNNFRMWQPPSSEVICSENICEHQPCYNKSKCIGTDAEYACIQSITVDEVLDKINDITSGRELS